MRHACAGRQFGRNSGHRKALLKMLVTALLKNEKIETIAEMVQKTESEMLKTKNFGRKSLNEIKEILSGMGLGLGMKVDDKIVTEARRLLAERPTEV
jgi:DNA-directed RNA polymerase alpha subunit